MLKFGDGSLNLFVDWILLCNQDRAIIEDYDILKCLMDGWQHYACFSDYRTEFYGEHLMCCKSREKNDRILLILSSRSMKE